jgi:hypothetical protein
MTRMLSAAMAAATLVGCGRDTPRPAETARADSALVPIQDTTLDTAPAPRAGLPGAEQPRPAARAAQDTVPPAPGAEAARSDTLATTGEAELPPVVPPRAAQPRVQPKKVLQPPQRPPAAAPDTAPAEPDTTSQPGDTASPPPAQDTVLPEPAAAPLPAPAPVPPPARAPDTVGTARPIPASRAAPVVPESGTASGGAVVPAGAELHAALVDSIHSQRDTAGRTVTARLMENVAGPDGRTLLPAGAEVRLTVVRLAPSKSRSAADGELELRVDDIDLGGTPLDIAADVRPVPHELRGRGVTGSEAVKVGAGAAAGAIAGRVLGGDTRGAVIGGVVGAAGGAAVAAQTADRDVVVKAGTPITFVLTAPLSAPPADSGSP